MQSLTGLPGASGVVRFTADYDLIVELSEEHLKQFLRVMKELGYKPKQPVPADDPCNSGIRRCWADEKNMIVYYFIIQRNPLILLMSSSPN